MREVDIWRIVGASALHLPSVVKERVRKAFIRHPMAYSAACGVGSGVLLGFVLVDGQKAHEKSVYGRIFKEKK